MTWFAKLTNRSLNIEKQTHRAGVWHDVHQCSCVNCMCVIVCVSCLYRLYAAVCITTCVCVQLYAAVQSGSLSYSTRNDDSCIDYK